MTLPPQQIYYNIDIINGSNTETSTEFDPPAQFSETRDEPLIYDISQYKMSITRFTMNGMSDLPLFIPVIAEGQSDPNKTIYSITVQDADTGDVSTEALQYFPENNLEPPQTPFKDQSLHSQYYYAHTYNHFVKMVNNAFDSLLLPNVRLKFDAETNKFTVVVPKSFDDKLFFNGALFNMISNLPNKRNYSRKDFLDYEILFKEGDDDGTNYNLTQEFSSLGSYWSPISSIVFTSNTLPIIPEAVAPTVRFGDSNNRNQSSSQGITEPIITDIALTLDNAYDYKQFISYTPSSQYRFVSFTHSRQALKNIDINIYWKSRLTGELIPLRMNSLSNISIKILFQRLGMDE